MKEKNEYPSYLIKNIGTAKKLKKIGFDIPCNFFLPLKMYGDFDIKELDFDFKAENYNNSYDYLSIPTYVEVLEWFRSKGYDVKFLYGGDSYFDNMKDFFTGNGYEIVDSKSFSPQEVTFSNIWGVCDEDMANKAIKVMNEQAKTGKPFFNHWMTVSNHRPFTYPDGKIDIPPTLKKRIGGVKYTDYALKHFFELAKQQEWYKNTLFVIVADHCASSAGSTELPLDGYRIPCFIYADFITPKKVDTLVSQIDVMPTVLGLLNFEYTSKFIGQDVFSGHYTPRAYIATYQDLGYLSPTHLTIVSPLNKIRQYQLLPEAEQPAKDYPLFYEQQAQTPVGQDVKECISAYQATSHWLKKQQLNAVKK